MIKFGTLKQVDKEKINISIGKNETTAFKNGKKEQSIMNLKQLYEKNKTKWIELTISNTLKLSN